MERMPFQDQEEANAASWNDADQQDVEMEGSETESWHPPPVEISVMRFHHWNALRMRGAFRARQDMTMN